ncbi:MAG TPA: heme o synthase, partial [Solirubrobacterales bacterium]
TAAPFELSQVLTDYVTLTKPKVQLLLLLTTVTTMYVAGDPSAGLVALTVNPLAAALSLSGLLGYVFVYTLWLKRATPQNIVIGGAAGAVPPLVAWAAVTGGLSGTAFYLFAIVFFWTPPHFWALSLLMKDEYARAGVPMLPVVRGEDETRRQILLYTILLYAVTQLPFCAGAFGVEYLVASMALGGAFIYCAVRLLRSADRRWALRTYLFSLAYLALLFLAMPLDRVV